MPTRNPPLYLDPAGFSSGSYRYGKGAGSFIGRNNAMYRQGDVMLLRPVIVPDGAVRRKSDIVARGEATGHAHRLVGGELWESDFRLLLVAGDNAALVHEEHARVPLPKTEPDRAYTVLIQREYDDEEEWQKVRD